MAFWPTLLPSSVSRGLVGALCCLWAFGAPPAAAQATPLLPTRVLSPDGGTRILNQATIVYEDATGRERSVTTNEVALVVQSVYAGQIGVGQTKTATPLSETRFVHTLTNTGNVATDFCVSALPAQNFGASIQRQRIYLDRNRDSLLDSGDSLIYDSASAAAYGLVSLKRDAQATLILLAETGSQPSGHALMEVQAQIAHPDHGGACTPNLVTGDPIFPKDKVQDRINVEAAAALDLAKASEYLPGAVGVGDDRIRYTLTLTNRGSATAYDVVLIDQLEWPMTYMSAPTPIALEPALAMTLNSGRKGFSLRLTQPLAPGASVRAVFYAQPNFLTPPPPEGWLAADEFDYPSNFDYSSSPFTPPPVAQPYPSQENVARVRWRNVAGGGDSTRRQTYSNRTLDYVVSHQALGLRDTGPDSDPAQGHGLDGDAQNGVQLIPQAGEGATIRFDLFASNLGDEAEMLQIFVAPGNFPPGTVFSLRHADGQTRLSDPDGDGWFNLGVTQAGVRKRLAVVATLPMGVSGGGFYDAPATLRLASRPTATASATLRLGTIVPARLDIAVNRAGAFNDGGLANQDPPSAAAATLTGRPGEDLGQTLALANEGGADEDALLQVWLDEAMTLPAPADWLTALTVSEADATAISHVGSLAPSDVREFRLRLRAPADAAPGLRSFYVSARGAASAASDVVRIDVAIVAASPLLRLSPDRAASVNACAVAHYVHRLENLGGETIPVRLRLLSQTAFSGVAEWPSGPAGAEPTLFLPTQDLAIGAQIPLFDAAAAVWTSRALVDDGAGGAALPLGPGDWTLTRLRVFAPCAAGEGAQDVAVFVAETPDGALVGSVRDVTTIAQTAFLLEKAGATDLECDGEAAPVFVVGGVSAPPRACVIWRLTASNLGAGPVCNVRIVDDAPEFTVLQGSPIIFSEPTPGGGSCSVSGATVACLVGSQIDVNGDNVLESHCLRPGESAEARFTVRIE